MKPEPVWHRVPPDSPKVLRLKGEMLERRARLNSDLETLAANKRQIDVDIIMLDGSMRRLAYALDHPED